VSSATRFGVTTDYDARGKRDYLDVWAGGFMSEWEARGVSLPMGDGYMLTTYNGDKVRVTCPTPRNETNYREIDAAIQDAMAAHYAHLYATGRLFDAPGATS